MTGTARPRLILVTGPAGSGKTTLAYALGRLIGAPVVSRDAIKEGMVAARSDLGPGEADRLTWRTYDVFFAVLDLLLGADVTVIAEAAFQHPLWAQGLDRLTQPAEIRVLRCAVEEAEAGRRIHQRLGEDPTRRAHDDLEHLATAGPYVWIDLSAPTLEIRTTEGYEPDLNEIASFCRM